MHLFRDDALSDILEVRVVSSRGKARMRGVKKKYSKFPIKHDQNSRILDLEIGILAPT